MKKIKPSWTTSDNKMFFTREEAAKYQDKLNFIEFINEIFTKYRNSNHVYQLDHVPEFLIECQDLFENFYKAKNE